MSSSCSHGADSDCRENSPSLEEDQWSAGHLKSIIDRRLRVLLPGQQVPPQILHMAFGYSVLAPGKRLRPMISMLTGFHLGRRDLTALDCACAMEIIHAASLILDDLPCMDDATLRRGQPTLHKKFGEDIAVLSGVGLLNAAYGIISKMGGVSAENRLKLVELVSSAVGSEGLIGGQVMDLKMRSESSRSIEQLNALKTGALFVAAAEAGAIVADADEETLEHVRGFAMELGMAFQIADDILDTDGHNQETGKDKGLDIGKPTLRTVLGDDGAREAFHVHVEKCRQHISALSATDAPLGEFIEHCLSLVDLTDQA